MLAVSRRHVLRQRTLEAHQQVDAAVGTFDSHFAYARYLTGQLAFRRCVEEALARTDWPAVFGAWRPLTVAPLITQDMDDLGLRDEEPRLSPLRLEAGDVIGTVYVLEGSGLGARVLRQRAERLGFTAGHGARHLAVQAGNQDGWREFLRLIEAAEPFEMERTVAAAQAAFDAAGGAFARVGEDVAGGDVYVGG